MKILNLFLKSGSEMSKMKLQTHWGPSFWSYGPRKRELAEKRIQLRGSTKISETWNGGVHQSVAQLDRM